MSITPEAKARLEAAGHQAALSYVDALADQRTPLLQVELLKIHRLIFAQSWPEIAGRFRNENIEIAGTSYLPPHWRKVQILGHQALGALDYRLIVIPKKARDHYLDTLEAANQGDLAPFTDFVAEQYERSLDQVLGQAPGQNQAADEQS